MRERPGAGYRTRRRGVLYTDTSHGASATLSVGDNGKVQEGRLLVADLGVHQVAELHAELHLVVLVGEVVLRQRDGLDADQDGHRALGGERHFVAVADEAG